MRSPPERTGGGGILLPKATEDKPSYAKATEGKKSGRLITSHRSTTYSCCLPALGGFSRSWSCKTCRRKDKAEECNLQVLLKKISSLKCGTYLGITDKLIRPGTKRPVVHQYGIRIFRTPVIPFRIFKYGLYAGCIPGG